PATARFTGRPVFLSPASSLWALGCDSLQLHSRVPTEHARQALCFLNGPVVFWDLSRDPQDFREGGRSQRKWERVPVKFRYPFPPSPKVPI
ncbi:unnamed protein product, partial [Staurois parvus]